MESSIYPLKALGWIEVPDHPDAVNRVKVYRDQGGKIHVLPPSAQIGQFTFIQSNGHVRSATA